mmetsp:Transcript_29193/g.74494  ORF Transcript_29193/g.74494 Transcript_29193/m.74494 type:complete len:541 (-) Transcript_29193:469-2091(-)|eukprot:CAMPEP_0202864888 /NCGR_PEP_ID=MMETSP1391-20130828/4941_1 /ASSEMBLY_ACC=CAM_ASM_000867 /TAXON_ID=1034604 /ORGANISM="Chlamydomonas leiostraca, Strain SAG 11-49" /LENGTH=540 /DNA_ID=CAMNT_0049544663 /DNA_START=201 /DNA_END=1823 /DNA_ORIENTATION=-
MADRRPLRFWQPFNDWWRAELDKQGRRPTAAEIVGWYNENASQIWGAENVPSIQETRIHAKCLRSNQAVREYFREYRAKKRNQHGMEGDDGEYYDDDMMLPQGRGGSHGSTPGGTDSGYTPGATPPMTTPHGMLPASRLPASAPATGWGAAGLPNPMAAPLVDPMQQQELMRNYMMLQAQHTMALHQQLTLAALTQQYSGPAAAAAAMAGIPQLGHPGAHPGAGFMGAALQAQSVPQQGAALALLAAAGADMGPPQPRRASAGDAELRAARASGVVGQEGMNNSNGSQGAGCACEHEDAPTSQRPSADDDVDQARKRRRHTTSCIPEPHPMPAAAAGIEPPSAAHAAAPAQQVEGAQLGSACNNSSPAREEQEQGAALAAPAPLQQQSSAGTSHRLSPCSEEEGVPGQAPGAAPAAAATVRVPEPAPAVVMEPVQAEQQGAAKQAKHHEDHESFAQQLAALRAMSHEQLVQEVLALRHTLHIKTCTEPCCGHNRTAGHSTLSAAASMEAAGTGVVERGVSAGMFGHEGMFGQGAHQVPTW